jgi:hypothetical protein
MAFHIDVDWNGHGFELDAMRLKVSRPRPYRVGWRNSVVRQSVSGHCNFERWIWRRWDVCLQWGFRDKTKPSFYYHPEKRKWQQRET